MKNLTEVVLILDCSGSMYGVKDETIEGYNSFLDSQKKLEGECLVTSVIFSGKAKIVNDREDLKSIKKMTEEDYKPHGCTALYDAVGGSIYHINFIHRYIREEDRPDKVLYVIITDGMENASRKYSGRDIKNMIEKEKEKGNQFIFLAANIDTEEVARDLSIDEDMAYSYESTPMGVRMNFATINECTCNFRQNKDVKAGFKSKKN